MKQRICVTRGAFSFIHTTGNALIQLALPAEEALCEGGDDTDLDEEAEDGFPHCEDSYRIAGTTERLEESALVEVAHAEDQEC